MAKIILMLLTVFTLTACTPYMTYHEMTEEVKVTADPKERIKLEKRIDRFERDVIRANAFTKSKAACGESNSHFWVCFYKGITPNSRRKIETLDDKVREYRRERSDCGCATKESMRDLFFH